MNRLGEKIKSLRQRNRFTQQEVAEKLGLSLSGYRKYENGQRDPNLNVLKDLAVFYNVTTDYLLGLSNIENNLDRRSIDIMLAKTEVYATGLQYERLKNTEGEDVFITRSALNSYNQAQGHYNKLLIEYMEEFFENPNLNPNEDLILQDKFPVKFSIETDLFRGAAVHMQCNDGTDLGRVKYFTGGISLDQNVAVEKCKKYIREMKEHFRMTE